MKNKIPLCLILLLVALYVLDQATKWYIVTHYRMPMITPLISFMDSTPIWSDNGILHFNIVRLHNSGVAFGMGNGTVWAPFVFLAVQVVALVGLFHLFRKGFFCTRLMRVAWAFVTAGVLGNMTDRLLQGFFLPGADAEGITFFDKLKAGYVVDFLDFSFPWLPTEGFPQGYHWPSFNVADSCVCIAAGLFIISAFFTPEPEKAEEKASAA